MHMIDHEIYNNDETTFSECVLDSIFIHLHVSPKKEEYSILSSSFFMKEQPQKYKVRIVF